MLSPSSSSSYLSTNLLLGFILLCTFCINTGESVQCYVCNSVHDSQCVDPFTKPTSLLTNCNDQAQYNNLTYTRCLKMTQTVENEYRVIRDCAITALNTVGGGSSSDSCLSRTGTYDVRISYCECTGDDCNASTRLQSRFHAFVAIPLAVITVLQEVVV